MNISQTNASKDHVKPDDIDYIEEDAVSLTNHTYDIYHVLPKKGTNNSFETLSFVTSLLAARLFMNPSNFLSSTAGL